MKTEKNKVWFEISLFSRILGGTFLLIILFPYLFDSLYGESIVNQILNNITSNMTNPDDIALSVMKWEYKYFYDPYTLWNRSSILQRFGFYKINGSYKLFIRNAPVSWIIYSRLANCGEYAKVFVYFMNKKGIQARLVHAPGEDHAWAEYYSHDFKIVVDPLHNKVIPDKRRFARGKNWSYIESFDLYNTSHTIDVSDEYISRGSLRVLVLDNNHSVEGIDVIVKSPYLMNVDPVRYKKPRIILVKHTDKNGESVFKLGPKEYIVEVKRSYLLFDFIYSKNITVTIEKETNITFNLDRDNSRIKLLNWFN